MEPVISEYSIGSNGSVHRHDLLYLNIWQLRAKMDLARSAQPRHIQFGVRHSGISTLVATPRRTTYKVLCGTPRMDLQISLEANTGQYRLYVPFKNTTEHAGGILKTPLCPVASLRVWVISVWSRKDGGDQATPHMYPSQPWRVPPEARYLSAVIITPCALLYG